MPAPLIEAWEIFWIERMSALERYLVGAYTLRYVQTEIPECPSGFADGGRSDKREGRSVFLIGSLKLSDEEGDL